MSKIIEINEIYEVVEKIRKLGKKIVLAGGCFDILHAGHLVFLENAKREGDVLILFLESDENVRRLKGKDRPINSQDKRADALANISFVDFVIKLSKLPTDKDYDRLIAQIKPDLIAITEGDPNFQRRKNQAEMAGGIVKSVARRTQHSTTKSARYFEK